MQIIITTKKQKTKNNKKCSSCYRTKILNNFGFKKNGKIYKSCIKCRNKSNIMYTKLKQAYDIQTNLENQ